MITRRSNLLLPSLAFVTAIFSLLYLGCAKKSTDTLDALRRRDELVIGVFGDKPPFGYIDQTGRNIGFDVALARELGRALLGDEKKVKFVTLEAANRVAFLQSNKVDIILANFTNTPERAEVVDFAEPYMRAALGVVVPDNSPLKTLADLRGHILIVDKGTTAESYFVKNYPDIELLRFDQNTEAFQALKDGRGAALSHDNMLLFAWNNENPGFRLIESNLGNADVIAPAVKKGNTELLQWTNEQILRLRKEGFFRRAYESDLRPHFGSSIKDPGTVLVEGPST
jgi:polar amino acid transport system substrate-binding protein